MDKDGLRYSRKATLKEGHKKMAKSGKKLAPSKKLEKKITLSTVRDSHDRYAN
jgi:hypothetical protein